MSNFNQESVLSVHHWTDTLFSFTTTRNPSFRFRSGEFTMIGLKVNEKPLLRAYSVASASYEDQLEFFSIKVPDGPLTSMPMNSSPSGPTDPCSNGLHGRPEARSSSWTPWMPSPAACPAVRPLSTRSGSGPSGIGPGFVGWSSCLS